MKGEPIRKFSSRDPRTAVTVSLTSQDVDVGNDSYQRLALSRRTMTATGDIPITRDVTVVTANSNDCCQTTGLSNDRPNPGTCGAHNGNQVATAKTIGINYQSVQRHAWSHVTRRACPHGHTGPVIQS
jgi:hypothetical protein